MQAVRQAELRKLEARRQVELEKKLEELDVARAAFRQALAATRALEAQRQQRPSRQPYVKQPDAGHAPAPPPPPAPGPGP